MDLFKTIASTAEKTLSTLAEPLVEDGALSSDRLGGTVSVMSTLNTQASTGTRTVWSPVSDLSDKSNAMAMNKGLGYVNAQKMVQLKSAVWTISDAVYHNVLKVELPKDFYPTNSFPARGPTRYFKYLRTGFQITATINAAPGMAGALVVYYVPNGIDLTKREKTTLLMFPHVMLNLASASSGTLDVPYVSNMNYVETDSNELGVLLVDVWAPLNTAQGSQSEVDVTIFGSLNDLDLQAPRAQMRPKIDIAEGPGALLMASAPSNERAQSLALAEESAMPDDTTPGSRQPVEDLVQLVQVPLPWIDTAADHLISWPGTLAPGESIFKANVSIIKANRLFTMFANAFTYYRGSLIFRLTSFGSIFNKGRLKMAVFPLTESEFTTEQANNSFFTVLDIGLQSSAEIKLPFHSQTRIKAVDDFLCRVEIFTVNKLQYNAASPSEIKVMLTLQADEDFQFHVPRDNGMSWQAPVVTTSVLGDTSVSGSGDAIAQDLGISDLGGRSGGPQDEGAQVKLVGVDTQTVSFYTASHTLVSTLLGRAYLITQITTKEGSPHAYALKFPQRGHLSLIRMFAFWFGNPVLHVVNHTPAMLYVAHSYTISTELSHFYQMTSMGVVGIPAEQAMSVTVPWYRNEPVGMVNENDHDIKALGTIHYFATRPGDVYVYLSFANLRLYFPVSVPLSTAANPIGGFNRLLLSGDVETNPGPVALVYKNRGLYKHYGLMCGADVVHLDSENILETVLNGTVKVVSTPDDGAWERTGDVLSADYMELAAESLVGLETKFSADFNCETLARVFFPTSQLSQAGALAAFGAVLILSAAAVHQQVCPQFLSDFAEAATKKVGEATAMVSSLLNGSMISTIIQDVSNDILRQICMLLIRIVCYGILYCSCPNLLTTASVLMLVGLDLSNFEGLGRTSRSLMTNLLSGDLWSACEAVVDFATLHTEGLDDYVKEALVAVKDTFPPRHEAPLKDFNDASLAAKNISWWVKLIRDLIDMLKKIFCPDGSEAAAAWVRDNVDRLADIMAEMDTCVLEARSDPTAVRRQVFKDQVVQLTKKAIACKTLLQSAQCFQILGPFNATLSKLQSLNFGQMMPSASVRMEPIGVWISGGPGQGKSFLATQLAKALAKDLEFGTPYVYPHPVGSEFFDGYSGQPIHIFDDFGQVRDEADLKCFCQCVSSVPFSVPMAELSEKGMAYVSKFVFATTNRNDFRTQTLCDSKALERRFPFKLYVRAADDYTVNGKLDVSKALADGALESGAAWVVSTGPTDLNRVSLDLPQLVAALVGEYALRAQVLKIMQQSPAPPSDVVAALEEFQDSTSPFECLSQPQQQTYVTPTIGQTTKFRDWVRKCVEKIRKIWEACRPWVQVFAGVASVVSIVMGAHSLYTHWRRDASTDVRKRIEDIFVNPSPVPGDEQRPYSGFSKLTPRKEKITVRQQGPQPAEWFHLTRRCCYFITENGTVVYGFGLCGKKIYIYSHVIGQMKPISIHWNGLSHKLEDVDLTYTSIQVEHRDGSVTPCDLVILEVPNLPWVFKNSNKYIVTPEPGSPAVLTYMTPSGPFSQDVGALSLCARYETVDDQDNPTVFGAGIRYIARTARGMCGGLLVQKQKGSWQVVGMHVAGNGTYGYSTALFPRVEPQGVVVSREPAPTPLYTPTKTKLRKSPLYGLVPATMGPAPLHPRDKRIMVGIDNLVKEAATKYRVDVYEPNLEAMEVAADYVTKQIYSQVGMCGVTSLEEALNGTGGANPIDLKTSAGPKYVQLGLSKKDLIYTVDGRLKPTPRLEHDVNVCIQAIEHGSANVVFGAVLKDEIVKDKKIKAGAPRCIEACSMDYTAAYRMVMGQLYGRLYESNHLVTGVAVGIDPYTQFHDVYLMSFSNLYAIDYTKFDGSLPRKLMELGVHILAACHENPELVKQLHEPVLTSTHWVSDELWTVHGGMPSGAPCTSVLNSVVNVLVVRSICHHLGMAQEDIALVTYGDDVLLSTRVPFDSERMVGLIKDWFGMEATSVDKESASLSTNWSDAMFLKRTFRCFPGTAFIVGVLDLTTILQKIQWCRGLDEFKSQLESATMELALHGKTTYTEFREKAMAMLADLKVFIPPYEDRLRQVYRMFFE
nr:RNA-dependent RNA polymerase [Hippocampus erectus picornavirus 1]